MATKAIYTHGHHESVLRSHRWRTATNSAAYLLPHMQPGMTVLDIGCGPGTITADLAAIVAPGEVVAVEISAEALEIAKAEAAARSQLNIEFVVGDVNAIAFPDTSFDVVHAHQVLQHVADPVAALREMRRVCKPDGLVAARESDYAGFCWFPELPALDDWRSLYRSLAKANGGEPDAGRKLLSWALAAGFADVTAGSTTWCFATPADRAWWGGMWADRILSSAMGNQAIASGSATPAEMAAMSAGWTAWAAVDDGWLSIPHGEIVCRR